MLLRCQPLRLAALACLLLLAFQQLPSAAAQAAQAAKPTKPEAGDTKNGTKGLSGAALAAAIDENSEAQEFKEEPLPVTAQVVESQPAAVLAAGTGDISTTGSCETDVDNFCKDVAPGLGLIAKCLSDQLAEEAKPTFKGDKKIGEACKKELQGFKQERAGNINKDVPLAEACVKDVEKLCKASISAQSTLACLREKRDELSEACVAEVFERQVDAADDWRTDLELAKACKADAESNCKGVDSSGGKMQECLGEHRSLLSWECQEQLFRQEVENAEDLRLSVRLFRSCLEDKKKFCPDVQPGNARAKECLEDHRLDDGFSAGCKTEVEKMMAARAADFRLDPKLRKLCKDDIKMVCGYERESMDTVAGEDAIVIQCLQDYRDEIENPACAARVQKIMEYASSDIRFDVPLADACYEDREAFCDNVAPGSARVIRCLQGRRAELSYECKATLFDQEVRMAESIDFQYPMKKACGSMIQQFCKDVPKGHARVVRCLQEHLEDKAMPAACAAEVANATVRSAQDYRLNYRLSEACHDTIAAKCADSCSSVSIEQPCGGTVLRCLTEKLEEIESDECKREVFYFVKMEVRDFRNDVILAEACRQDVDTHCKNVLPGEGRVHACLRENRAKLTDRCRAEEVKLAMMEAANTELMPSLARACKAERAAHCKDVRPGKARVFSCLLQNSGQADYSAECTKQMGNQQARRVKDWRLDYDLRNACKADVASVCASTTAEEDKENGAVFKCLVARTDDLNEKCSNEVVRSVRNALQFFTPGMPVTDVCDSDAATKCNTQSSTSAGAVRSCLADLIPKATPVAEDKTQARRRLTQAADSATAASTLGPACEALVRLAHPQDAFAMFDSSWRATGIATQARYLESKFGLKAGTLTPHSPEDGVLTLTGWTAVLGILAVVVVAIVGGVMGYRHYRGWDQLKGYTMVLKDLPKPRARGERSPSRRPEGP